MQIQTILTQKHIAIFITVTHSKLTLTVDYYKEEKSSALFSMYRCLNWLLGQNVSYLG